MTFHRKKVLPGKSRNFSGIHAGKLTGTCEKKLWGVALYDIYIYKKLKEQLDKHIKLSKIKLQMLLLLYDKELTRDCTKAINIYKRNFYKNGQKIYTKSMLITIKRYIQKVKKMKIEK